MKIEDLKPGMKLIGKSFGVTIEVESVDMEEKIIIIKESDGGGMIPQSLLDECFELKGRENENKI